MEFENVDEINLYNIDSISEINIHINDYIYPNKTKSITLNDYITSDCIPEGESFDLVKYYLDNYPGPVSTFALDLASAPGSSASVERLFSQARLVCSKKRMKMTASHKTELILLKSYLIFTKKNLL